MTKDIEFVNYDKKITELITSNYSNSNSLSRLTEVNRKSLKELISYLTSLKKENLIDERQFTELVTLACANFIENEVETRVSRSVNNRVLFFLERI